MKEGRKKYFLYHPPHSPALLQFQFGVMSKTPAYIFSLISFFSLLELLSATRGATLSQNYIYPCFMEYSVPRCTLMKVLIIF